MAGARALGSYPWIVAGGGLEDTADCYLWVKWAIDLNNAERGAEAGKKPRKPGES